MKMSKDIRGCASDNIRINNIDHGLNADIINNVIFVVGSKQQIDLFLPLHNYLRNFKIQYFYIANWGAQKCEIENYLSYLNITYFTIGNLFGTKQIDSLIERINPDIVILGHDTIPPTQIIVQSAKKFGIPTLLIQDGIYGDNCVYQKDKKRFTEKLLKIPDLLLNKDYSILDKIEILIYSMKNMGSEKRFVGRGDYSKIAVFGDATRKMLENEGIDSRRIIVTGSPKFDCLYNYNSINDLSVYQQLNLLPNKKTVLLITQPFVEGRLWNRIQWEEYISQIGIAIEKMTHCQLIIKIRHNRENINEYTNLAKTYKIHPIICKEISLSKLIIISDVTITVSSTGGLETIAAEKPLIIFDPFDTPGSSFYNSRDILFLKNIDDLSLTLNKILSDSVFRKNLIQKQYSFLKENTFQIDGKASERIYDVIIDMIKNN